ncbi:glycosyltransferase family 87 protein [Roseibium sp. FZY0029]|uniref:glycosyltransferase family 87 protein n=1 Tax=Roseibium sp. FZY0029 TaxID=3116647 RepID=UPI002EC66B17|nr:glycosyltransferase family 87 protein [Roseibium sp. FZY0029]
MKKFRQFYLRALHSDELARAFGGPFFVAILISTSLLIAGTWIRAEGGMLDFSANLAHAPHEDFAAFYRGGEMAAQGEAAEVYDYRLFAKGLSQENQSLLFLNPPQALVFFEPLASLSYPTARGLVFAANALCLFLTIYMIGLRAAFWPYVFILTSAGAFYALQLMQISPIAMFLLVFALLYSGSRPILSGLALCILTIKPQYGLLVPVYLLSTRDWRTFAVASVGTLALIGASVGLYGVVAWQAFWASLSGGVHSVQFQMPQNMIVTVGQSLGKLGAGDGLRFGAQIISLFVAGLFVYAAARHWNRQLAAAMSLLAMCVAAPSFLFYDWLMYAAALLLLLRTAPEWPVSLQIIAGLLWSAPVLHDVLNSYDASGAFLFSSLMPALGLAVLIHASVTFFGEKSPGAPITVRDGA